MQRKIKFRGKHINTVGSGKPIKEWYYGCLIIDESKNDEYKYRIQPSEGGEYFAAPVIPETVGQYTGLEDNNGKEIYEGDIVKGFIPEIANEPERKGVVEFGEYGWIVDFKTKKWESKIGKVGFCSFRDYEVIGNTIDNPELLQEV